MGKLSTQVRVTDIIERLGGPVAFAQIADAASEVGLTRSQVHNAVYSLGKSNRISSARTDAKTVYWTKDVPTPFDRPSK